MSIYFITSKSSGLAAWWGLINTSTVDPTAHGSMPKICLHLECYVY